MKFIPLTRDQISEFILKDEKLLEKAFCDEELEYIQKHGKYPFDMYAANYTGIADDEGNLVCVSKWEQFTKYAISMHYYMRGDLHGTGYLQNIFDFLYSHFRDNTQIIKIVVFVTEPSIHAIKGCEKHGFKKEGFIADCLKWRGESCGLYIYGLPIIRDEVK